jgi:hypothetical protein
MVSRKISKRKILAAAQGRLELLVARWSARLASDHDGDAAGALRDLNYGGCISGVVGGMIYYRDTCRFYERNKEWIWEALQQRADDYGGSLAENVAQVMGEAGNLDQFENNLAWFAFEWAGRRLADRLGID